MSITLPIVGPTPSKSLPVRSEAINPSAMTKSAIVIAILAAPTRNFCAIIASTMIPIISAIVKNAIFGIIPVDYISVF